jgi:diguanylate cyclase (GGDEF)-like protein/PAS domain S-box-containing protein
MPLKLLQESLNDTRQKLQARENSFKQFEALANLGSWEVDLKTHKSIWSAQTYKIYGLDEDTNIPSLELFYTFIYKEDLPKVQAALQKAIVTGKPTTMDCRFYKKDKTIGYLQINGQVTYDSQNIPNKVLGTTQDITKFVETELHANEFAELIEHSSNEIYIVDLDTLNYLYVNKGACEALGYTSDELLKMNVREINPHLLESKLQKLKESLLKQKKLLNRTMHRRKDGTLYHVQSFIHTMSYYGISAYVIFDTDITQQVEDEKLLELQAQQLNHQANHDALTGLPNRMLFKDRLTQMIHSSKRNNEQFALLFIDLDQFKKINDSLGHHIGDEVLVEAAKRLQDSIREEDTLARLGGDEFTIIIKDLKDNTSASIVAQKIIDAMQEPISIKSHQLYVSSSIGISIYPNDAKDQNNLIKYADLAMYKAKDEGRNNYQFYSADMTKFAFERVVMESSLRVAINNNEFEVYFQPQFDTKSEKIIGMEALVRWIHPTLGIVPPGKFIPLSEENGLIIDIDKIVMKKAMWQFAQWKKDGLEPGILAINLSMKRLNEKDFTQQLVASMQETGFEPHWLELEVTESQVMHNPDASIEKLKIISDLGVELAIDDFGTGYSSLSYLKKLPLDKLKIDQSFVRDIPQDEDDVAITKAIIALAKSLNLKLIAEGVETLEQKNFMIENGCDYIQGYYYSKPLPMGEIEKLLRS